MSWRGRIVVECDNDDCRAETVLNADDLDGSSVNARLFDEGWLRYDGIDTCPICIAEASRERERDADDGSTYGHPGDALRGRE